MQQLVRKIIWQGQQKQNFLYAGIGFLLSFLFLLLAVQLYNRVYVGIRGDLDKGEHSSFLIVSKKVNAAQLLKIGNPNFSKGEVDELKDQRWVEDMGAFKSNSFTAAMSVERFADMQLYAPLEAVEDRFLDTLPDNWEWQEGDDFVPLIISTEFLNIYNGVWAPSMNYPRFSREMIKAYPITLYLIGNGKQKVMRTKVAGFSDRIVSVLVPDEFLEWANDTYGSGTRDPSRMILQVPDPGDKEIKSFLAAKNYETNQDMLRGTAAGAVRVLLAIMGILGLLFLLLSTIIFLMAFQLTISRARDEIDLLLQLGHDLNSIARTVVNSLLPVILGVAAVSVLCLFLLNNFMRNFFVDQGYLIRAGIYSGVWLTAVLCVLAIIGLSWFSVRRSLLRLAR